MRRSAWKRRGAGWGPALLLELQPSPSQTLPQGWLPGPDVQGSYQVKSQETRSQGGSESKGPSEETLSWIGFRV